MKRISVADLVGLSVADRLRLVQSLWDSIAAVPEAVPLTEAEREELDRRLEAYYRHPKAGSPWKQVLKRLKRA